MKNPLAVSGASSGPVGIHIGWISLCVIAAALVGLLVGNSVPAAAAEANAVSRITFGIEPASATGADGRPNFSFGVTPGATLFDHVALVNYSSLPLSLQLYATDGVQTSGGGFGLLEASAKPTGVGAWISLPAGTATVQVPAQTASRPGEVVVPITVQTPANASPGDHVGGIVASLQTAGTNKSGQRIVLDQRIGTRVFVRVSGPLTPKVVLTGSKATYSGTLNPIGQGRVRISYVVRNTGNVDLALAQQSVSVSGLIGSKRQVDLAKIPLLLPGSSVAESAVVTGVWPQFVLSATETAQPLPLAGSGVPAVAAVTSSASVLAIPWTLIVIVILLAAALYLVLRARSRRAAAPAGLQTRGAR